jgi:Stage II sporulation protein E (SpoIIE)
MASYATRPTRSARASRRVAVAIAAGCCVLGLGALPTAQAAKGSSATSSSTVPAEPSVTLHGKRAERAAQAEAAQPIPAVAPSPAVLPAVLPAATRGRRTRAGKPVLGEPQPLAGASAGAGAGASAGPPPRRLDREPPAARVRRRQDGVRRGETASAPETQAAAVSVGESTSGIEALARRQKKSGKGGKEKSGKGGKEKGKESVKGKEPISTPSVTGKGAEAAIVASSATADPSAVTASLSSPAATPASGVGPASITSAAPAAKAPKVSRVRAQRAARSARRRAAGRASATPNAGVSASAALLAPSGASAGKPSAPARSAVERPHTSAAQPALVKTITRIVGVVPTPVRILIAALVALALALAVRSRLSGVRARRLMRQRGQLLEDVGLLQAALLPVPPARLGPVATSVAYRPADGPGAGGDFYDVFALDDGRLAVIVGDVSGHGREALPHTALVRFTVRAYLEAGLSPRKALQTAGSVLDRQLGGSFATVVAAVYHPRERTLTYSSAGHPPPVVLGEGAGGEAPAAAIELTTACSAPPIGAGMRTGTRETVISVPGPARLCFHTDGVTEARIGEDLFGGERLSGALSDLGRQASAPALLDSVAQRTDSRPDDMAACLLRVEDGAGAPAIVGELVELDGGAVASGRAERFLRESGMTAAAAAAAIDTVRLELDRRDSALLELTLGQGPPRVSLENHNVVHAAALTAVGAS